jgi:outer membrane receptor for ferrienterochelin and colicin
MSWLLVLLFSFSIFAQETKTIKGILLEKGTRIPLKDVSVFILPHKFKAVTNEKGDFFFENVPAGECTVIINLTGYDKLERKYDCGKVPDLNFYLEKKFYTSFETTVIGKVTKRDDQAHSLTQEEFIKAPGSFGGDPVRAAQNLPGVAATGGSAQIIVQGASPEDTGYLINGHRVPLVFHFGGLSSVIIPEAVERVDLLPSGYGPEYSKAIGGIIGLTTKNPKEDRVHGMAYVDLLNAGGLVEGPIDEKSSFLVSGRYSYIGQVLKAVAKENEDFELTAAPTYYDFTSIYKNKINDRNEFKTTFIFSKDELELILNKPANDDPSLRGDFYTRTEFFRIIPQLTTQLAAKHKMDNSFAFGKDSIFVNISGKYLDINSNVISQRSEIVSEWKPTYKTYIGLDNQWIDSDVNVNLPNSYSVGGVGTPFSVGEIQKFRTEQRQTQLGAYLRQEIKTSEDSKWTYLPNVRVDHFTLNTETHVQPRFQLRYQMEPSLLLRGAWGKYVQPPQPQESSRQYGNSDIKSPYAYHYMAGFTKDFREGSSQGLEFTNNYFYKELKDLVVPSVEKRYDNTGTGTIIGGEVQAKYRKNEWSSQIVYTYLKSTRHIPGYGTRASEYDQTHNINLIGAYNKERWTFSSRFRFVSGLPYTPVTGGTFDSDNDVYIPTAGSIYSQRFDSFKQLDIRIDRKFIYEKWIMTAYLDIQNVTNSKNEQNIQYAYDYSDKKKVRGLPILPTFGIKGEF